MVAEDKKEELTDSLHPIALLRKFEKMSWKVDILVAAHEKASVDRMSERFLIMEHDFKVMKRLAWAMLAAVVVIGANSLASHFSIRIADAAPPVSQADRLGTDRVPRPTTSTP